MASLPDGSVLAMPLAYERTRMTLWRWRLALGWTTLFAALVGLFALSWDIQWHTAVGRDRTLTAPHLFILGSAALMGLIALIGVLLETAWARRNTTVAQSGTIFAGFFSSSLGMYLVGYGALDAAIGFPIDQYWHTLYGVDVTIWAPFHIMLLTGFCVCCLGVVLMLIEGAHLALQQGAKGAARAGYISAVVAFATLMGMLSILLPNALTTGYFSLGGLSFTVYPLMLGATGTFVLIMAIRALPGRLVATQVALVYACCGLIIYLLVPQLMTWLLGVEQQSLLPDAPTVPMLAIDWQYSLIIAAVLLDLVAWMARRGGWSWKRTNRVTFAVAALGMSLAAIFYPLFFDSQLLRSAQAHASRFGANLAHTFKSVADGTAAIQRSGPLPTASLVTLVIIVVVSLLLGVLGTYVGNWLGAGMGALARGKEG